MLARIRTSTMNGIHAVPVEVEVTIRPGKPLFIIIGLGDNAVKESKDRVLTAIRSSGFYVPDGVILVSLAPAELRKEGSAYDLPIALGVLAASHQIPVERLNDLSVHGELALDGRIKAVRGAISMVIAARTQAVSKVVLPYANREEGGLVAGVDVLTP
jgi:magnesium chelatase family protein